MMPVRSHQIEGGSKVLLFACDVCGAPASFGEGVNVRAALATGDVKKAGTWYCAAHCDPTATIASEEQK